MKTQKAVLLACVLTLIACLAINLIPSSTAGDIYKNVIRLHVIANSDSEHDQAVKLAVRDSVLEFVSDSLESCERCEDAYAEILSMKDDIEKTASLRAAAEGTPLPVRVEFGRENYPTRYYDEYALPAGEYTSVRIIIGEGEGHNWWCVLFPPLCTASASADKEERFYAAGFTPEEYRIIKRSSPVKYRVRFKILELLSETFGFSY